MTDAPAPRHSRRGLFAPLIIALVLLAAWTVWWFWLAGQIEGRLKAQAEAAPRSDRPARTTRRSKPPAGPER